MKIKDIEGNIKCNKRLYNMYKELCGGAARLKTL